MNKQLTAIANGTTFVVLAIAPPLILLGLAFTAITVDSPAVDAHSAELYP